MWANHFKNFIRFQDKEEINFYKVPIDGGAALIVHSLFENVILHFYILYYYYYYI